MVAPFTAEQLEGIKTSGTFTVNSRRYAIPYKWQISTLLQLGTIARTNNFYDDLGTAFSLLMFAASSLNISDIGVYIKDTIKHILLLYVGLNSSKLVSITEAVNFELEKERQKNIYDKYWGECEKALF